MTKSGNVPKPEMGMGPPVEALLPFVVAVVVLRLA